MKNRSYLLIALVVLGVVAASLIYFISPKFTGFSIKSKQTGTVINLKKSEQIDISNSINMEFVLIKPGAFTMGASLEAGDEDEAPEHKVTITKPFYLGKYEVTQEQWEAVMGNNPSEFKGAKQPVDSVSWDDCQIFLNKLQEKTRHKFTLPTEAQWEYACRAGTTTPLNFGSRESLLVDYAWFQENSENITHPVGQKKPNPWGLYDLYGNVQEWCNDWYANPYPKGAVSDPQGPASGDSRVLRGGAWGDDFTIIRSSYRNCNGTEGKNSGIGLRVVMVLD